MQIKTCKALSFLAEMSKTSLWSKFTKHNWGQFQLHLLIIMHSPVVPFTLHQLRLCQHCPDESLPAKVIAQLFKNPLAAAMTRAVLVLKLYHIILAQRVRNSIKISNQRFGTVTVCLIQLVNMFFSKSFFSGMQLISIWCGWITYYFEKGKTNFIFQNEWVYGECI